MNEVEEISGYLRTEFDCINCGEVNSVEGDATDEEVACTNCSTIFRIRAVR